MMVPDKAKDAEIDMLNAVALAVHRIVGNMPVVIKFKGWPGILVEDGAIIDRVYENRELDRALFRPGVVEIRLSYGRYAGRVMYASPIKLENASHAVGVIGVVDTSGVLKLKELAENHIALSNQVADWCSGLFYNEVQNEADDIHPHMIEKNDLKNRPTAYRPGVVDLGAMIEEAASRFKARPGKYMYVTCVAVKGIRVQGDESLRDAFTCIIDNAIKHIARPAFVKIRMVRERNKDGRWYCTVAIDDNSPGIPDDMKERIFNRIYRVDMKATGSGLGLYLVKSLVESHGGKVWVEDKVKGDHTKGARFMVMLPVVE